MATKSEQRGSLSTAELMVRTAIASFAERGYEATSMRLIAEVVGVQPASLYNHFSSKSELLWAIVKDAITELQSIQEDASDFTDPMEAYASFVRTHVAYHAENGQKAQVVNTRLNMLPADQYEEVVAFRKGYERKLQELVRQAAVVTRDADVVDVRTTAFAVLEMGMAVAGWFKPGNPLTVEELCVHYVEYAKRLITRR